MDRAGKNSKATSTMERLALTLFIIAITIFEKAGASTLCPPLPSIPGIVISCSFPSDNDRKVECLFPISGVQRRTIGKYKCEEASMYSENVIECRCRGKWKGMAEFQNYTTLCQSSPHAFSLDGPPELNLTAEFIHKLANDTFPGSGSVNMTDFKEDALAYHNLYRKLHGAAPLKLNRTLSEAAQKWAQYDASQGQVVVEPTSINRTYISNIYSLSGPLDFDAQKAARLAVGRWYKSGLSYDYDIPVASAFSSMIWNATTDLGVGVAAKGGQVVVICNYWPPGNVYVVGDGVSDSSHYDHLALFKKNVFRPVGNLLNDSAILSTTRQP